MQFTSMKDLDKYWARDWYIKHMILRIGILLLCIMKLTWVHKCNTSLVLASLWIKRLNTLHWRHNEYIGVSNHQPHGRLLNRLLRRRSKKTSKLRVTGLCAGNSSGTGEFPAQMASYAENVSIWWRGVLHNISLRTRSTNDELFMRSMECYFWCLFHRHARKHRFSECITVRHTRLYFFHKTTDFDLLRQHIPPLQQLDCHKARYHKWYGTYSLHILSMSFGLSI